MELLEFQETSIWKNKFYDLHETLSRVEGMKNDSAVTVVLKMKFSKIRILCQIILSQCMQLTLLSLNCLDHLILDQLFSVRNYMISNTRNRLTYDLNPAWVAVKRTKYEPRLDKLLASTQHQKSN